MWKWLLLCLCLQGCQLGLIPCPDPGVARMKRSRARQHATYHEQTLQARAAREAVRQRGVQRLREGYMTQRHTKTAAQADEWDCPRPGMRKHLPRSVRQNIKRNRQKVSQPAPVSEVVE